MTSPGISSNQRSREWLLRQPDFFGTDWTSDQRASNTLCVSLTQAGKKTVVIMDMLESKSVLFLYKTKYAYV